MDLAVAAPAPVESRSMTTATLRRVLPAVAGLVVFVGALEVLRVELRGVSWPDLTRDVAATPVPRLLLAVVLTAINYLTLTGYDLLAFRYVGRPAPAGRVARVSFLAYAISHNVGFSMLSGTSIRYRYYSRMGVTADELSRIVVSYSITFWLGLCTLGGVSLLVMPPADGVLPVGVVWQRAAGGLLLAAVVAYLGTSAVRRAPVTVGPVTVEVPPLALSLQQLAVSVIDWSLAAAVLFLLVPSSDVSFLRFVGAYLFAVLAGLVSHVPGGVGVFEGLLVLSLAPDLTSGQLLPALVVYRAIYYLAPFAIALTVLAADELRQRRAVLASAGAHVGQVAATLTPRLLSLLTFAAGVVLLASGATPASPGRLDLLDRLLPLGLVEASHFLGSVAGAGLLVLSQGLARRLDAAYYLSSVLIVVGMTASLLKGFDYEEAALLCAMLLLLRRSRPAFDRRAAFFDARVSPGWVAAVVGAVAATAWLGVFAFKHVAYSQELWWQFELHGEASRMLRASTGAAVLLLVTGLTWLLRPAVHETAVPSDADLADAGRVIAAQPLTSPNLVYLRDKAVLFNDSRTAFLMYAVQGRTWVALGDPVGPPQEVPGLIRQFLERCDDYGGTPAFYEIGTAHLHRYADFGMTFVKLGEDAKVDLPAFTTEGSAGSKFRQAIRKLEREGGTFRVIPPEGVPAVMHQLKAASDDWLQIKAGAEKGFSLGFFDATYLARFPVAVIERRGRIEAFANLWRGADGTELSLDLMRYHRDAPNGVMEALMSHVMLWGKAQGYRRFALGMAPLSGFESSSLASFWNRIGAFLYEHGEAVYSFQGLRAYKQKFNPVWEPRYLAYPGGLRLPRIMADTSALIAGGYRRIFLK